MPSGLRNSSSRISPGCVGLRCVGRMNKFSKLALNVQGITVLVGQAFLPVEIAVFPNDKAGGDALEKVDHTTKNFKTWKQFKGFTENLLDEWIYRGQSNAEWDLKTSLERTDFFNKYENIEFWFLTEFQRSAKNFIADEYTPDNLTEWLSLMQHHGAPTRLLDFTRSPQIAAYFAFEEENKQSEDVAIWAIRSSILENYAVSHLEFYLSKEFHKSNHHLTDEIFEKVFWRNEFSCAFPIEPFKTNKRFYLQQATFIATANSVDPLMEQLDFLEEAKSKAIVKIILPKSLRKEILAELQKMNINRATLFPGLEGYALSLKMRYNLMDGFKESLSKQLQEIDFLVKENIFRRDEKETATKKKYSKKSGKNSIATGK